MKNSDFVHLHTHSHYSLLDGLGKIDDLLERTKKLGMDTLALTDHGAMYGAIEFYQKAKKLGIKPIIGCEIYISPRDHTSKTPKIDANPSHLVLLAKDKEGYLNLIALSTEAHLEGFYYKPRVDKELLRKHNKGLIALSACLGGEVPRLIMSGNLDKAKKAALEYQDIFGKGNFYLELQNHPKISELKKVNEGLIKLSRETGIPLVATNDIHYVSSDDVDAHKILLCVQTGAHVDDEEKFEIEGEDFYMRSPREMSEAFPDIPEAILNTKKIADICNLEIELGKILLPRFEVPKGYTADSFLREICLKGLYHRYADGNKNNKVKFKEGESVKSGIEYLEMITPGKVSSTDIAKIDKDIVARLEYELSVIEKTGFASYFLIVADFVNYAKSRDILVGPGRGSAAGSIVSYALNITNIDPLEHDLIFERFLNPERISMPDIDMDFADNRRSEVIEYVSKKYGADHVAQIITFGTMAARAALRDTGRAMGIAYSDVDKVAKMIPFGLSLDQSLDVSKELKSAYGSDSEVKKLVDMAKRLEGVARHASTHAAGVVISEEPLIQYAPLQKAVRGDTSIVTQYAMGELEDIGLLKMDFLGLSNLTIIVDTIEIIEAVYDKKIDIDEIPLDDEETYKLLSRGETTGVFQLESDGMKRYIKELKPTLFEDITSIVALYRPGPMENIPDFINRKHGRREVKYLDESLVPILEKTYGVIVTQEQVLQIAQAFAGFTLGEADVLRKAVGKKIRVLLHEQEKKFISGAVKRGHSKELAQKVFNLIKPFAGYGFNKSHAACYAMIAYQTAYLKAHYPDCFMAALLTSDQQNIDRITIEIAECKRMGIDVLPPDINESFGGFAVVPDTSNIRFGLSAIKNVGEGAIESIVKERKRGGGYKSVDDFAKRVDFSNMNRKILESLIKSGAMDSFGERERLLASIDQILAYTEKTQRHKANGQTDIFGAMGKGGNYMPELKLASAVPIDKWTKLFWEKSLLGVYISEHPMKDYDKIIAASATFCGEIPRNSTDRRIKIGGIITKIQKIVTRSRELMLFAEVEDTSGSIEVLVFPKVLEKNGPLWQENQVVLVSGRVSSNKDGETKIVAEDTQDLSELKEKLDNKKAEIKEKLYLRVSRSEKKDILKRIKDMLTQNKGLYDAIIVIGDGHDNRKVRVPFGVDASKDLIEKLQMLLGDDSVVLK